MSMVLEPSASQEQRWEQLRQYRDGINLRRPGSFHAVSPDLTQYPDPRTISRGNIRPSGRDICSIAYEHGLTVDELIARMAGQLCLDLGGGYSTLEKDIIELGEKVNMVTIDDLAVLQSKKRRTSVAAIGQVLPFADSVFDRIIATYSLPSYADNPLDVNMFLSEGMRTLREGGSILISPIFTTDGYGLARKHADHHMLDQLDNLNNDPAYELVLRDEAGRTAEFTISGAVEITKL